MIDLNLNVIASACFEHISCGKNKKYIGFADIEYYADDHKAAFRVFSPPKVHKKFIALPKDPDNAPWVDGDLIERKSGRKVGYIKTWQEGSGMKDPMYFGEIERLSNKDKKKLTIRLTD